MAFDKQPLLIHPDQPAIATNLLLRNTYWLLAMTLVFSAATAGLALVTHATLLNPWLTLAGYFGLLFLTQSLRDSRWGVVGVFALTGFMGYTLGPILNFYLHTLHNGSQLIMMSLGCTGLIFLTLSGYSLATRKNFSYLTTFITIGTLVAFVMSLAAVFWHWSAVALATSAMFVLLSSGYYIMAN